MLVITREVGEEVVIGDPARPTCIVRVEYIRGNRTRLSFDAPRHVEVHRREIADKIADQRHAALD